jgi:hypothetical protein
MQSGGSVSPSVVHRAGRPARRSAPRKGTTRATVAVVVVAAVEGTPPATTAAADRTPPAVEGTPPVVAGIPRAVGEAIPAARARCIPRCAPNAAGRRKFPSSLARTSRSTAGSASSCGGRRRLRATTTTRTRSSPEGGGQLVAPFSWFFPCLLTIEDCGTLVRAPSGQAWRRYAFHSGACDWISMNPGQTTIPVASTVSAELTEARPAGATSAIVASRYTTSP